MSPINISTYVYAVIAVSAIGVLGVLGILFLLPSAPDKTVYIATIIGLLTPIVATLLALIQNENNKTVLAMHAAVLNLQSK